ncbi:MAG: hypothetical protein OXE59_08140 [Bacteroidetes bacterium]|nr:hypothetical protein [Bacteroidota bacterium]MCY4233690.1 hypothetical protein [Bacteroidota bacterium]
MEKKTSRRLVSVYTGLTSEQKQSLEHRAKTLGVSVPELIRKTVTNPKRSFEESLVREWVAVGLQLQKIQSQDINQREIQPVLDKIKSLIQQSLSGPSKK